MHLCVPVNPKGQHVALHRNTFVGNEAMTLPWYLNPWAEVRRLRDQLRSESDYRAERHAGFMRYTDSQKREIERLKTRVAELEQWEPPSPMPGRLTPARKWKR